MVLGWEPVFQHAVHDQVVWVPAADGTVIRLDRQLENAQAMNPFSTANSNRYVTGPLVVDADGTLLYNVIELDRAAARDGRCARATWSGSRTGGPPTMVLYQSIVNGAPAATDQCPTSFGAGNIPGPYPATVPVPTGVRLAAPGVQLRSGDRPGRRHLRRQPGALRIERLVAGGAEPGPDPEVDASGCESCSTTGAECSLTCARQGAPIGVDPSTGLRPSVKVDDQASSVPVALPDGAVLYGGVTRYNGGRGHLVKVGPDGQLMGTYDFGWDVTPAVWVHDGTYSIITKDNHYQTAAGEGPYDITQLSRDLVPEWKFTATQTQSCHTLSDGGITCVSDHPDGFEWCVNAPAIGPDGTVYANSEDGRVYSIRQGGTKGEQRFLLQSLGAAYTPIAVDSKGRVYSMNGGVMTVVGQ